MTETMLAKGAGGKRRQRKQGRQKEASELLIFGLIHDARAEAQNLKESLDEIRKSVELRDQDARENETRGAVARGFKTFDAVHERIEGLMQDIAEAQLRNPEFYDRCGDEVTHIRNYWRRARDEWPTDDGSIEEVRLRTEAAERWLDEIILHSGLVTLPSRVNRELQQLRIGQTLDVGHAFDDELPNKEHQRKLLFHMYAHPLLIEGVVDAERGVIYRSHPNPWRRVFTLLGPLVLVLAGLIFVLPYAFTNATGWLGSMANFLVDLYSSVGLPEAKAEAMGNTETFRNLLGVFVLLFAGGVAHLVVGIIKSARGGEGSSMLILDDFWTWAQIRKGALYQKILFLYVGFFGLVIMPDVQSGWQLAFFVGYSIDSFVDIFLQRFNQTISTSVDNPSKALTKAS